MKQDDSLGERFGHPLTGWFVLCLSGILLDLVPSKLALFFHLPLFLDSIGTIWAGALGGPFSGMVVGFLSNVFNSIGDSITLYYGLLSICIGGFSALFSRGGWYRRIGYAFLAVVVFALIGGAGGSVMTWYLYGEGLGQGISAPYAHILADRGLPVFWAQFSADMMIDILDKAVSVSCVCLLLRFFPDRLCGWFPLGYLYDRNQESRETARVAKVRKRSLYSRIVLLLVLSVEVVGVISISVSTSYYQKKIKEEFRQTVTSAATLAAAAIDGDRIGAYLSRGVAAEGYETTKHALETIFSGFPEVTYLYVYAVKPEGCHVVFDLDTPVLRGNAPGEVIPIDESFKPYMDLLLSGKEIPVVVSDDSFGWLMSCYHPVKDSSGKTVCYACADISMDKFRRDTQVYLIKMIAMLFSFAILLAALLLAYARTHLVEPVCQIIRQTKQFQAANPFTWLTSREWLGRQKVRTGDEIEQLYDVVDRSQWEIATNMIALKESEQKALRSRDRLAETASVTDGDGKTGLVAEDRGMVSVGQMGASADKTGGVLRGKCLLVCDALRGNTDTLEGCGCTIVLVEHGQEMVDAYRTTKFDAILMDGRDECFEAVKTIRQSRHIDARTIPVILLGFGTEDANRKADLSGCLSVPVDPARLSTILEHGG